VTFTPTNSPSIAPECEFDVAMACEEASTGIACDMLPPMIYLQCRCPPNGVSSSCATSYIFRYTGATCDDSGSGGDDDYVLSCVDSRNFAMPEMALIVAKDMNGGEISRAANVEMGLDGCIPDVIQFEIHDEANPNVILQALTVSTKCAASGIQLADSAGSLVFSGYTCDGGKVRNCFTDIVFEMCALNVGIVPMQLKDVIFSFDGDMSSPLKGSARVFEGNENCLQETREISICAPDEHVAKVDVEACKCRVLSVLEGLSGLQLKKESHNSYFLKWVNLART
jgi:hypothetical protein